MGLGWNRGWGLIGLCRGMTSLWNGCKDSWLKLGDSIVSREISWVIYYSHWVPVSRAIVLVKLLLWPMYLMPIKDEVILWWCSEHRGPCTHPHSVTVVEVFCRLLYYANTNSYWWWPWEWLYICYRLDLDVDSNISQGRDLKETKINYLALMAENEGRIFCITFLISGL